MRWSFLLLLAFVVALPTTYAQKFKADIKKQSGFATYYADKYHGRTTAYGETYDRTLFTCASQDFPKNSLLRVTRTDNGQQIVVRVNDRGPWGNKENVIDLSYAAALQLDMIRAGRVQVRIEKIGSSGSNPAPSNPVATYSNAPVPRKRAGVKTATTNQSVSQKTIPVRTYSKPPEPQKTASAPEGVAWLTGEQAAYGVQIAAYSQEDNATRQAAAWAAKGIQNVYLWKESTDKIKVIVGKYASRQQAETLLSQLKAEHQLNGFVKYY